MGLWLVLYLFEHLLVNSQAVFLFENEGAGFVRMVNKIHALPYLRAIELLFLGVPFVIHGFWGVRFAWMSKLNSFPTDGSKPALPQFKRNRAYSWQRITSWILLVAILAHVVQMRFLQYPQEIEKGTQQVYLVKLPDDPGLPLAVSKLGAKINSSHNGKAIVEAPTAGAAFLLNVRATFMSPLMVVLYSLFVITASYHAFNGLWTAMIKWGVTLSRRSQMRLRMITTTLMGVVMFLGLMSTIGTYLVTWLNE